MVNQKVTPEEKLLRLIESGGKVEVGENVTETGSIWNVGSWPRILSHGYNSPIRRWSFFQAMRPEFNLRLLNRVLVGVLILVVIGIAFEMNNTRIIPTFLTADAVEPSPAVANEAGVKKDLATLKPLLDYLKEVDARDIFNPAPAPRPKKPEPKAIPLQPLKPLPPPQSNAMQVLQEKIKTLKLVGISWGEDPVAMIEDTTKKETNFLKAGQSINEIQVKTILRDKVVLSYKDAEYDIF